MTIEVLVRETNGGVVIAPKGPLDGLTTDPFVQECHRALGDAVGHYILDLSEVPYISSAGLSGVLILARAVHLGKGTLTVCIPESNKIVRDLFRVSGFSNVMNICVAVEDALK